VGTEARPQSRPWLKHEIWTEGGVIFVRGKERVDTPLQERLRTNKQWSERLREKEKAQLTEAKTKKRKHQTEC